MLLLGFAISLNARGQAADTSSVPQNPLQQHYDAAHNFQAAGDLERAAFEYKIFLAEALHRLANRRAKVGDSARAGLLFEEALKLAPNDVALLLDYAQASLSAGDLPKAESSAKKAVESEPRNAKARLVLGRIMSQLGENEAAKKQFETALAIKPDFEAGYALATAYLKLKDIDRAQTIFSEMVAGFGDTAELYIEFGRAYLVNDYTEQAIQEFKKAIAKDKRAPTAHYFLGAAYLLGAGDAAAPEAVAELREELKTNPQDFFGHYQLGSIALKKGDHEEAEGELTRAATIDPQNPAPLIELGQLYTVTNRPSEAETVLRKAILLTKEPSRNNYQIQRAHYMLGRLLLRSGRKEEGENALKISGQLLKERPVPTPDMASSNFASTGKKSARQGEVDLEALTNVESFEKQIGPAIADGYNNLGAITASRNDFTAAITYFEKASEWNPSLEGLDYNRGRAAFSANEYDRAVGPLGRYLQTHPDDGWARGALGMSLFMLGRLQLEQGDIKAAIASLEAAVKIDPMSEAIHHELATAYRQDSRVEDAEREMKLYEAIRNKRSEIPGPVKPN